MRYYLPRLSLLTASSESGIDVSVTYVHISILIFAFEQPLRTFALFSLVWCECMFHKPNTLTNVSGKSCPYFENISVFFGCRFTNWVLYCQVWSTRKHFPSEVFMLIPFDSDGNCLVCTLAPATLQWKFSAVRYFDRTRVWYHELMDTKI